MVCRAHLFSAKFFQNHQYVSDQHAKEFALNRLPIDSGKASSNSKSDALALHKLAIASFKSGDLATAICHLNRALCKYQESKDVSGQGWVLIHLGQMYVQQGQYLFAVACYEAILDELLDRSFHSEPREILLMTLSLAMQLCTKVYGAEAIHSYKTLIEKYLPVSDLQVLTKLLRRLGQFHSARQEYRLALKFYAQAHAVAS